MKKFFSLVLALVMALSLTTVAWAADPTPVSGAEELKAALQAGEDVIFEKDITVTATTIGSQLVGIEVPAGVSIDGDGWTLTVEGAYDEAGGTHCAVLFHGGTLEYITIVGGNRCLYVTNVQEDIILNNVMLDTEGSYGINVNDGDAPFVELKATDCVFSGWNSYGTAVTKATFDGCEFVFNSAGTYAVLRPYNETVVEDCTFVEGAEISTDELVDGESFTLTDCIYAGEPLTADNMDELIPDYTAEMDVAVSNSTGVGTNFYVADSSVTTKWALLDIFAGATIDDFLVEADYDETIPYGNIEYYDVDGVAYVAATKLTGEYKLVCGKTEVYLNLAADVDYEFEAEAFNGLTTDEDACGSVLVSKKNLTKTYYTATCEVDKVDYTFYFVADKNGAYDLLVGGKIVKAEYIGDDFSGGANNAFIAHDWVGNEVNATTKAYTSLICENCGKVAKLYGNADAAGKGAVYEQYGWITAADAGYVSAGASTTPATDKTVTSAETFDAGIAMYVGMSVMAAAGSAVVLGKKKD